LVLVLLLLYAAITIIGLFPFHGIPVLNVALGFPVGAAVADRRFKRAPSTAGTLPDVSARSVMRSVLYWAFATAGVTLLVCWTQLVLTIVLLRAIGLGSPLSDWLPLLPSPFHPNLFRAQLFAVILSPALLVLTTVFGGVLAVLMRPPAES